jgi:hypothetical protein
MEKDPMRELFLNASGIQDKASAHYTVQRGEPTMDKHQTLPLQIQSKYQRLPQNQWSTHKAQSKFKQTTVITKELEPESKCKSTEDRPHRGAKSLVLQVKYQSIISSSYQGRSHEGIVAQPSAHRREPNHTKANPYAIEASFSLPTVPLSGKEDEQLRDLGFYLWPLMVLKH